MNHADDSESRPTSAEDPRVRRVEILISTLLRVGVTASVLVVVAGTVLSFVHHPSYLQSAADLRRLTTPGDSPGGTPGAAFPHTLRDVAVALREGRGQGLVALGLILLIATPILRVAVSIIAFLYQRDRAFVLITAVVLLLLLLSFVLGKVE